MRVASRRRRKETSDKTIKKHRPPSRRPLLPVPARRVGPGAQLELGAVAAAQLQHEVPREAPRPLLGALVHELDEERAHRVRLRVDGVLPPLLDGLGELRIALGPRGVRRERRAPPLVVLRRVDPGLRRRAARRAAPRGPQDALEARRDLEVRLLRVRVPFDEVEDDEIEEDGGESDLELASKQWLMSDEGDTERRGGNSGRSSSSGSSGGGGRGRSIARSLGSTYGEW